MRQKQKSSVRNVLAKSESRVSKDDDDPSRQRDRQSSAPRKARRQERRGTVSSRNKHYQNSHETLRSKVERLKSYGTECKFTTSIFTNSLLSALASLHPSIQEQLQEGGDLRKIASSMGIDEQEFLAKIKSLEQDVDKKSAASSASSSNSK